MSNNSSDPKAGGAPELSPPQNGKREGEDGDEKQVSAKKQKRGEVAEEHRNKEEINSDYSEQDKNFEVKNSEPPIHCGSQESEDDGGSESGSDRSSDEDNGEMDIDEGDSSEESNEEEQKKKMEVLPKTPASLKEKNPASRTIYVRNLSYSVEQAEMEKLFKDCGEVLDIHLHTDREGRFRGFGHVKFSTAEAAEKALELNNTELLKRPIKVCIARDTHNRSNSSNSLHDAERLQSQTVYVKGFDTSLVEGKPKTTAYPKENSAASKSKTICVRNLSYSVERADMENLFKDCGEIVDVRLHTDSEGRFKGFGHVEFAIAEAAQKALQLDNTELLKCRIKVFIAQEKGEYTRKRSLSNPSNSFHEASRVEEKPKSPATRIENNAASKTIYVRNLSYSVKQADVENLFKGCGEIVDVRLHKDRDGRFKGFGHVEFATPEAAQKALELDNTQLLKRPIYVLIAQEKGDCTRNRSFSNSSNSFREASVAEEKPKSPATRKEKLAASKTIRVRNLSYSVEQADMENFFKDCGEIVDIRLHTNHEGWFDGFGHVEFATVEAAQKFMVVSKMFIALTLESNVGLIS
ncbi:RNA-binding domain superfamily [Sesbania bispinosa]|nr:RNA-binding domain superfamily [Sesbania bispinosa]